MLGVKKNRKTKKQLAAEKLFEDTFLAVADEQQKFKMAMGEFVHFKLIDKPMKKLVGMMKLRDELLGLSAEMNDRLKNILERFGDESYDKDTDEGLLEMPLSEYTSCFSVNAEKVQTLLWQEEKRLRDNLTKAEEDAERLQEQMSSFLKSNSTGLETFLKTAESQMKVLTASSGEREVLKDKLRQMEKYDDNTVAVLEGRLAQMAPPQSQ